ncbi:phosphate acyltransferase PlsX [Rhizomonospora bruguierae]|uniref:phosphate acyltransferase PlsX n=1 Tax=Rhizomonospora bruguierae TaxID=1581705 RepID=UPI001BCC3D89|nr:phosphate acyltransferase PlsX [Micromonospora sp. NBRC 107566]
MGTARIAVDLLGGDDAPAVVVDGALRACGADPDLQLLLVGPEEVADGVILALPAADRDRVAVRPAAGAVGMADPPVTGVRVDTTVRAAVAAVAAGHADAVVSAGATGATVTATVLELGRMPGIRRPPLAATVPALAGPVVLLDVGAAVEANAATLTSHAAVGAAYAQVVTGLTAPRVGLLSVGTEHGKGDRARRGADAVLAARPLPGTARYVGLVEGYEPSLGSRADVVVTDGFTGNVLLKGIEGAYALAGGSSAAPRAGALLGVNGTVVVCHGAGDAADLAAGIRLAAHLHRARAASRLAALVADLGEVFR